MCALDLDTGTITSVINPSSSTRKYEYQFADVAPSPNISNLLVVTGRQTPETLVECREPVGTGPLSAAVCPDATPPLLATRDSAGAWLVNPLLDVPASDAGLSVAWDPSGAGGTLYLSTEHSGAWKGHVSW